MTSVGYNAKRLGIHLSKIQIFFSLKLRINLLVFFFFKADNLKILASSQRRKMETGREKAMLLELSQQVGQPHGKKAVK